MQLKDIVGQEHAVKILMNSLIRHRVAHAYLLIGPSGVGKGILARAFAKAMLCKLPQEGDGCGRCLSCQKVASLNHPDLYLLAPSGPTIKIEQVRALQKTVHYAPYEGSRKIFILEQVEAMTPEAANSFLKILEEPPGDTVFILTASKVQSLLPTILSRCQAVHLHKIPLDELSSYIQEKCGLEPEQAGVAAALADGSIGMALSLVEEGRIIKNRQELLTFLDRLQTGGASEALKGAEDFDGTKEEVISLLDLLAFWFRDILIYQQLNQACFLINRDKEETLARIKNLYSRQALEHILQAIEETKKKISMNANIRLALEVLFLEIQRLRQ